MERTNPWSSGMNMENNVNSITILKLLFNSICVKVKSIINSLNKVICIFEYRRKFTEKKLYENMEKK